jgi:hypothetical protein
MSDVSQHDETVAADPRVQPSVRTTARKVAKAPSAGKAGRDKRTKADAAANAAPAISGDVAAQGDALRAALGLAIKEADEARRAVTKQQTGIERTRAAMYAAEKALEKVRAGVTKAQESHAAALARAAAAGASPPRSKVPAARQALVDAEDELTAQKAALAKLEKELPVWEKDAVHAEAAVEAAISAVFVPLVTKLIARGEELCGDLAPVRNALAALLFEQRPTQYDAAAAYDQGRRPLAETKKAVAEFLSASNSIERASLWVEARKTLRQDPNAALAEFDELLG